MALRVGPTHCSSGAHDVMPDCCLYSEVNPQDMVNTQSNQPNFPKGKTLETWNGPSQTTLKVSLWSFFCPDNYVHIECQCVAVRALKTVYPSNRLCRVGDVYLALGSRSANSQGFAVDELSKRKCCIPPPMAL